MEREYLTHDELVDRIQLWGQEAENGNRHDFAAAIWDLAEHVADLQVGDTFFGVADMDMLGDDRFALIEVVR